MSLKRRLRTQLKRARNFSDSLLSAFKTPQEWTHQVHPSANHALWFAGHMGVIDNFMIQVVDPDKAVTNPRFQEAFGMGSEPTADPAAYPPVEDVLAFMRDRRETLLGILDSLSDEDLAKPVPDGTPGFLKDFGSVFEVAAWHEGLHSGQVSVARRSLGNAPIAG